MTIRSKLLAACARTRPGTAIVESVDAAAVVRRLLLFDTYILESVQLLELPFLIRMFGHAGVIELLQAGVLKLRCDLFMPGSLSRIVQGHDGKRPRRALECQLGLVDLDKSNYLDVCLRNLPTAGTSKQRSALQNAVVDATLDRVPATHGHRAMRAVPIDLQDDSIAAKALAMAATRASLELPGPPTIEIEMGPEGAFRIESNLKNLVTVTEEQEKAFFEEVVFAVAVLNFRMEEINFYEAITASREGDGAMFEAKLRRIAEVATSTRVEGSFQRVIEIGDFPSPTGEEKIRVDALLKARDAPECAEFRQWIQTVHEISDAELRDRVGGLRARLARFASGWGGKAVKMMTMGGLAVGAELALQTVGVPAGSGVATSLAVEVLTGGTELSLEQLVTRKLLAKTGPTVFLGKHYRSLFDSKPQT